MPSPTNWTFAFTLSPLAHVARVQHKDKWETKVRLIRTRWVELEVIRRGGMYVRLAVWEAFVPGRGSALSASINRVKGS
jgi:hypothetical protein